MEENEKLEFHLNEIKKRYPGRSKLNKTQTLNLINISASTFSRYIERNDFHKLPIFKKEDFDRRDKPYSTYTFSILDIAKFLSE
ncbi:MAG: hypothetical protein U9N59_08885 [Campylobacterota bacterium]|nr:hypothetical protein [Campylobacterota bacterium]